MKRILVGAISFFILSGCSSTPKQWSALDGSKSDGTITLTYVYRPILDIKPTKNNDAINLAASKCSLWGFSGAEAFGEETKTCHTPADDGGCLSWRVKKTYQCTDK